MRDLTGTGEVMKRRIKEGVGEFPIDCPLEDNAVRVHFKATVADTDQVMPGPAMLSPQTPAFMPLQRHEAGQL